MLLALKLSDIEDKLRLKHPTFKPLTIKNLAKTVLELGMIPNGDDQELYERRVRIEFHKDQILDRANKPEVVLKNLQNKRLEETCKRVQIAAAEQGIRLRDRNPVITDPTSVNFKDTTNGCNTKLHLAVWNNDLKAVQSLCERGACIQTKNAGGQTPYSLALTLEHTEIISYFEQHKASLVA